MFYNGAKARVVEAHAHRASNADSSWEDESIVEGFQPQPDSMFRESLHNLCPNMTEVYALSNGKRRALAMRTKCIQ